MHTEKYYCNRNRFQSDFGMDEKSCNESKTFF
jgi:hypothetical protein